MTALGDALQFVTSGNEAPSLWGPALRLLLGTLVLAALVFLSRRWIAALLGRSVGGLRGTPFATVIGRHLLAPKKSLILVEVEGRRLLLAETADDLRLLLELGPPTTEFDDLLRGGEEGAD